MTSANDKKYPWLSFSDDSITPVSREEALQGLHENLEPHTIYVVVYECQELKSKGGSPSIIYNDATNLLGESIPPWHAILLLHDRMLQALEGHLRKEHQLVGYFKVNLEKAVTAMSLDTLKELLKDLLMLEAPSSMLRQRLSKQDWV